VVIAILFAVRESTRPGNADALVRSEAERTPSVRLLGHRTDVPDLMCAADVLSFPARWEGLGGTLIEAMACASALWRPTFARSLKLRIQHQESKIAMAADRIKYRKIVGPYREEP
jgi:glycosyltransferase involved in cell wall biosynthesis